MPAILKRLVVAGLAALAFSGPALAEPALWAIRDDRSTIYLFGTVHMLKSSMDWQSPKMSCAFAESRDVWLELIDEDEPNAQPLVAQLGFDPAHPLSGKISAKELARVEAAAQTAGLPMGEKTLEPMRPWLAAVSLTTVPIQQAGFDPSNGADHVLKLKAIDAGKPLHGLESLEKQLHFFADLPAAEEVQILDATLDEVAEGPDKVNEMVDAWLAGDIESFGRLFVDFSEPKYQALYKILIVKRNQAWAKQLADRLKTGSGTSFIAVGAGHLAGPDSLIVALQQRGITAERE